MHLPGDPVWAFFATVTGKDEGWKAGVVTKVDPTCHSGMIYKIHILGGIDFWAKPHEVQNRVPELEVKHALAS